MGNFAYVSVHRQCLLFLLFLSFATPGGCVGVYMVLKKTSKDEVICNCFYMIQMLTYQYSCGKRLSRKYGEGI